MSTAEELWAAAARDALAVEEAEEGEVELEIADGDDAMVVEEGGVAEADGYELMTAEEEAEAALKVQDEMIEIAVEGEVELEAEAPAEAVAVEEAAATDEQPAVVDEVEVQPPESESIEIEVDDTEEAPAPAVPPPPPPPAPKPPQPKPQQPQPQQPQTEAAGKACGKGAGMWKGQAKGKGKGAAPGGKGKGSEGKGGEQFFGLVHQVGEKTGNMLVKSWKVSERFGQEAMIPKLANPAGATLGDKISFEVLERENGARPLAVNVQVRGHVDLSGQGPGAPANELRRQVLYYLSDDNLRTDKFFQGVIASNEGGWISMATILGCPRMKQMKATCENVFAALKDATEVELREEPAGEEAIRRTSPPPPLDETNAREWGGGLPKGQAKGGFAKGKAKGDSKGEVPKGFAKGFAKGGAKGGEKGAEKGAEKGGEKGAGAQGEPEGQSEVQVEEQAAEQSAAEPAGAAGAGPCESLYYAGTVKSQMRMEPRKLFIACDEITQAYGRDAYFLPSQKPKAVEVGSLVVFAVPADSEVGFSPQASFVAQLAPLGSLGRAEEEPHSNGAGTGASTSRGPGVQKTIVKKGGGR